MSLPPNIAPLSNVAALTVLVRNVQTRNMALPGIGVFHGPSGYGKTTAIAVTANQVNASVVQVKSVWTTSYLLQAILRELGEKPVRTIPAMVDQIAAKLMRINVPLIIDDAHELAGDKRMIMAVRDIYESCQAPIILVGEEALPQTLTRWENVHNRVLDWVGAEPCTLKDAQLLTGIYSPDVEIEENLLKDMVAASSGAIRRVVINIDRAREIALSRGLDRAGRAEWGDKPFFDGQAPVVRRGLGAPAGHAAPTDNVAPIKGRKRA